MVTFDEKNNIDALQGALKNSDAKGLMFSPSTHTSEGEGNTRERFLHKLMPELSKLYPGDNLNLKEYPNLSQIIQLGHTTIRGTIKYKDAMVYANPKMTSMEIPENSPSDVVYQTYSNGRQNSSYTNSEITKFADELYSNHFSETEKSTPIFMSLDLETPLALATFLANNYHLHKVFIPATFNMHKILTSLKHQNSEVIVVDKEFYNLNPPHSKVEEYRECVGSVRKVIVGSDTRVDDSSLF